MYLDQLVSPALVIDMDCFEENIRIMKEFTQANGIALRPHYKSHKSTWIAHVQIEAGAKGITCAKLDEAEDLIHAGIEDVLIANQIIQPSKIARLTSLAGCCKLAVCVDQEENIQALEAAAALAGTTIHVLVEYDIGMKRCGVLEPAEFLRLARVVEASPHLRFDGIQAYAGHLSHEADYAKRKERSQWVETRLGELKVYVEQAGLTIREVSGSSTGTVEFRSKDSVYTELQAGSYLFMDHSYGRLNLKFKNSLFLLTQVISIVGKERIILDGGMKSVSIDQGPPCFAGYPDVPVRVSEEHCTIPYVDNLKIGDQLKLIPSHCCTTMNMHNHVYLVRGNKIIDRRETVSRGRSI